MDDERSQQAIPEPEHDTSPIPEADSPAGAIPIDPPLLCLRLVDEALRPRGDLPFELRGPDLQLTGRSDAEGVIEVEGCAPGAYDLVVEGRTLTVHPIFPADLNDDAEPYRVLVAQA